MAVGGQGPNTGGTEGQRGSGAGPAREKWVTKEGWGARGGAGGGGQGPQGGRGGARAGAGGQGTKNQVCRFGSGFLRLTCLAAPLVPEHAPPGARHQGAFLIILENRKGGGVPRCSSRSTQLFRLA